MLARWRPEGWKNPHFSIDAFKGKEYSTTYSEIFESGADTMLEALRNIGNGHKGGRPGSYVWSGLNMPKDFTIVIIPDE